MILLSRMLKTGIQYFLVDSMQTSEQEYLASQSDSSRRPLEKEEKRACLYSVRLPGFWSMPASCKVSITDKNEE